MTSNDPAEAKAKILVAAIGNQDRGDDGAGPLVAAKLSGRLPAEARLVVRSGDMMSLIEDWAGFDTVIFVDAAAARGEPGRIHRIDLAEENLPPDLSLPSSHAFGVAETIELARVLEIAPKEIIVYAIEGASFEPGAPFTPAVLASAAEVAERIASEVCFLLSSTAAPRHKLPCMSFENNDQYTARVSITGRVQGVGYRIWAKRNAETLGLGGWVRNRPDRSVEALFSGAAKQVLEMLSRCRQGPYGARVEDVVILEEPDTPHSGFHILPTA